MLTAAGITFNPGSIYEVDIDASGQSDRINATAAATIHGGHVDVRAGAGSYQPGMSYAIITAAGGRTRVFDGVTSDLTFLTPTLRYDANNVYLTLTRNSACFYDAAETPNEAQTGGGVERQGTGNALYDAVLNLTAQQARNAFAKLSGKVHATSTAVMLDDSRFIRNAIGDRLRAASGDTATTTQAFTYRDARPAAVAATSPGATFWAHGFGANGHHDGDGNAAGAGRAISGFFSGVDAPLAGGWRLGAVSGFSRSSIRAPARLSTETSDNFHLGLYGGAQWGGLGLRAGTASTWHGVTTGRHVTFPGFADRLRGRRNARTDQAFAEIGYRRRQSAAAIEPFGNLAWVRHQSGGVAESGGDAALAVAPSSANVAFATFGLRMLGLIDLHGAPLTLSVTVGWRHGFGDLTPQARLRFASGGDFWNSGAPLARQAAVIETGLALALAPMASLGVHYDGVFAAGLTDQSFRASVNLGF